MTSLPIPQSPADVTPEWLTEALRTTTPGVEVSRIEVLDQHTGTTGRMRIGVEYATGPSGPAPSMFVKLAPFSEQQRQLVNMTDMGRKEAHFYSTLAGEVPMRIPKAHYAAYGEDPSEYIMVLEDLEAAGCRFTNRLEPRAEELGGELIQSLARLHAHFWDDSRFDEDLSWIQPPMSSAMGAQLIDSARQQFADQFPPVFTELATMFVEQWESIRPLWEIGERTLIHGDTHAGNQFTDGSDVGLYDWAVINRSPGIRDVAIYLGNSCPPEVRRSEEEGWLRAYQQVLVDEGVADAPSYEELFERYRRTVLYSWVASTTTASMGSLWQPIEVGMLGMARATEACADLETIEAIREAL